MKSPHRRTSTWRRRWTCRTSNALGTLPFTKRGFQSAGAIGLAAEACGVGTGVGGSAARSRPVSFALRST